jgi:hypothetical protein
MSLVLPYRVSSVRRLSLYRVLAMTRINFINLCSMSATVVIHRAIAGRTNVRHYEGGKQEWMWHDLPVEGECSES